MRTAFGLGGGFCVIFGLPRRNHGDRFVPIDDSVGGIFIHDAGLVWTSDQIDDEPTAFPDVDGKIWGLKERGDEATSVVVGKPEKSTCVGRRRAEFSAVYYGYGWYRTGGAAP